MSLPFDVQSDPFEKSIRGMYGRFATDESYQLNYLLTSLPIKNIDSLHTATEAFDISKIDFEQLIQRDIDFERVEKIVGDYLEAGKNRVVFFPPLLVSLLSKEAGIIVDKYSEIDTQCDGKTFTQTWDGDKFQLILPISQNSADPEIIHANQTHNIYNFGANLRYNPSSVSLVVIDGQHRLQALKHLAESKDDQKKNIVSKVEIPLCIVFSPDAVVGSKSAETITNSLRELFVTINLKGKQVSGHFITLLDDNSLSAATVRDLADLWKKASNEYGFSRLHLLEWNQREARLAAQRQRDYSVTTVSILNDCLANYLFDDPLTTANMLNLLPVREELRALDDSIAADDISERNFGPKHIEILKSCIRTSITPSLNILFTKPSPYKSLIQKFDNSCKWLESQVTSNIAGAGAFKAMVLQQYRDLNKFDAQTTRTIGQEFNAKCLPEQNETTSNYFLNVFQQGLIRSWINLSRLLNRHEITPIHVADALVDALELICFNQTKALFDFKRVYTQKTLYNGERLIITKKSKDLWAALIIGTLANEKVANKFISTLVAQGSINPEKSETIKDLVKDSASDNCGLFIEEFKSATQKDYEKYWRDKDLSDSLISLLTQLSEAQDEDSRKNFDLEIMKITENRVEAAAERLSNVLEIPKESLFS